MTSSAGSFGPGQTWSSCIASVLPLLSGDLNDVNEGLIQFTDVLDIDYPAIVKLDADEQETDFHPFFIGQGASYQVYACKFKRWNHVVAVKHARVAVVSDAAIESQAVAILRARQKLSAILQEILILGSVHGHPNILTLLGWGYEIDDGDLDAHLIIDYSSHGSLRGFLRTQGSPGTTICEKFCVEIGEGLRALHEHGVVQGDLKLDNILIFDDPLETFVSKISDFGFAIFLDPDRTCTIYQGTTFYNAPEVAAQSSRPIPSDQLPACDVYSYGLTVWETFNKGESYKSNCSRNEYPTQGVVLGLGISSDEENLILAREFVNTLTDLDLRERLTLIFESTLTYQASQRKCIKDALLIWGNGLTSARGSTKDLATIATSPVEHHLVPKRDQRNIHGIYYHKYPWEMQTDLLRRLEYNARDPKHPHRVECCMEASYCYIIGVGTNANEISTSAWIEQARILGSGFAAAISKRLVETSDSILSISSIQLSMTRDVNPLIGYLRDVQSDNILYHLEVKHIKGMALNSWQPDKARSFFKHTAGTREKCSSLLLSLGKPHEEAFQAKLPFLHYAAFKADLDTLQLAIEYGLDKDAIDSLSGETALICALSYGQYKAAELLMRNGANASVADKSGLKPLHFLCLVPDSQLELMAQQMLRCGSIHDLLASVSAEDVYRTALPLDGTPLAFAAATGNLNAVRILLQEGREIYKSHTDVLKEAMETAGRYLYADICRMIGETHPAPSAFPLHCLGHANIHSLTLRHGHNRVSAVECTVGALINMGFDVNAMATRYETRGGRTPLSCAITQVPGSPDIILALIEQGADIEAINEEGSTPLECAILAASNSHNSGYVPLLLAHGIDPVRTTSNLVHEPPWGCQPLHVACQENALGAVQCLLAEPKVDVNGRNGNGETPLHIACSRNRIRIVRLLVEANANFNTIDSDGRSPLEAAVRRGCNAMVIHLLDLGISIYNEAGPVKRSILSYALSFYVTRARTKASLNLLLHERIRQFEVLDWGNESGYTALGQAIMVGQYAVAHELLRLGAPVHHPPLRAGIYPAGLSPLIYMIVSSVDLNFFGHQRDYGMLLENLISRVCLDSQLGAKETTGSTALHYACRATNLPAVQMLLAKGADPKATALLEETPLHRAIRGVIKKLRPSTNGDDESCGPTATLEQLEDRLIQIVDLLLAHGAQIDSADIYGYTVLHDAILTPEFGAEMAQCLLTRCASASAKTLRGETPLHMVVMGDSTKREDHMPLLERSSTRCADSEKTWILIKDLIESKASIECLPGESYNVLNKAIFHGRWREAKRLSEMGVPSSMGTQDILTMQHAEHRQSQLPQITETCQPRRLSQ